MELVWEVGKFYVDRKGRKVECLDTNGIHKPHWPISVRTTIDNLKYSVTEKGIQAIDLEEEGPRDVVKYWDEPVKQESVPETPKQRPIDQAINLIRFLEEELGKDYVAVLPAKDVAEKLAKAIIKAGHGPVLGAVEPMHPDVERFLDYYHIPGIEYDRKYYPDGATKGAENDKETIRRKAKEAYWKGYNINGVIVK